MPRFGERQGYGILDVLVGLALLALIIVSIYRLYLPTFALSQRIHDGLQAQQDVRLAVDRVARALHETTTAVGRLRVYPPESGCRGSYDACVAFVTPRDDGCTGSFHLIGGAADWQATIYVWRDAASHELRLHCDATSVFPAPDWPPPVLEPHDVVARNVAAASFTVRTTDGGVPTAIAVALEEQPRTADQVSGYQTAWFNQTVFFPQNR
jgi:hypothetical protein